MAGFTSPYDALMINIQTYGSSAGAASSVQAVGLPPLGPVLDIANTGKVVELKTKYHYFPGFPDPTIVNDLFTLLKRELPAVVPALLTFRIGTSGSDSGIYMVVQGPNANVEVNMGIYAYEKETLGDEVPLIKFRQQLHAVGIY